VAALDRPMLANLPSCTSRQCSATSTPICAAPEHLQTCRCHCKWSWGMFLPAAMQHILSSLGWPVPPTAHTPHMPRWAHRQRPKAAHLEALQLLHTPQTWWLSHARPSVARS
jgi:hypothetical protein